MKLKMRTIRHSVHPQRIFFIDNTRRPDFRRERSITVELKQTHFEFESDQDLKDLEKTKPNRVKVKKFRDIKNRLTTLTMAK
jgi:hypothetical protein